jgi:hypothetical protein
MKRPLYIYVIYVFVVWIVLILLMSKTNAQVTLIDSTTINGYQMLYLNGGGVDNSRVGQSFTGQALRLDSVCFFLRKLAGSPTGNVYAKLYTHTGTFGISSLPGDSLVCSDAVDVSTVPDPGQWIKFNFTGLNKYPMAATYYCIYCEYTGGNHSNSIGTEDVYSSATPNPQHPGNLFSYVSSWSAANHYENWFMVYGSGIPEAPGTGQVIIISE